MDKKRFHVSDDLNAWPFDTLKHRMEENNCKTLIVDYLQLINIVHEGEKVSRSNELRHEMELLNQYARLAQCRIIVLYRLSRLSLEKKMHPEMVVFPPLWDTYPKDYNYYILMAVNSPDLRDWKRVSFISVTSDKPNLEIGLSMDKNTGIFCY